MANMSYCRFENTLGDLRDCKNEVYAAIELGKDYVDFRLGLSSENERIAFDRLYAMCSEFIEAYEQIKGE